MRSNALRAVLGVLILSLMVGCATVNLSTPHQKYLAAQSEFNLLAERYLRVHDTMSEDLQMEMSDIVVPLLRKGQLALDIWWEVIDGGGDPTSQIEMYMDIKNEIIDAISEYL